MSNYDEIKEKDLEYFASLFRQITICSLGKSFEELPKTKEWEEYLKGNSMFLPFDRK